MVTTEQSSSTQISIAELMGLDISEIPEARREALPIMRGLFSLKEFKPEEHKNNKDPSKNCKVIIVTFEVERVDACADPDIEPQSLLGKTIQDRFFIREPRDMGYVKGLCFDFGVSDEEQAELKSLGAILAAAQGNTAPGETTKTPDKDDASKIYTNIKIENRRRPPKAA